MAGAWQGDCRGAGGGVSGLGRILEIELVGPLVGEAWNKGKRGNQGDLLVFGLK